MPGKTIKQWPEDERPRERLLRHGPAQLSDAQLIAIILRTGQGGRTALDMGMELLARFGSLKSIEQAGISELCSIKGLGRAKASQLKAALELSRRVLKQPSGDGSVFSNGADVHAYYSPKVRDLKKETFFCMMLDVKNRLIKEKRISEGTLTASLIHPREAFRDAIREAAASVIFVHNHPSGDPRPSQEDIAVTGRLAAAGETIGIKVLDHIIIGDGTFTSMLDQGYLASK